MKKQTVLVLDFGGQYNQLIARRVREQSVYCELLPYNISIEKIKSYNPIGIIFTGGPNSSYAESAPKPSPEVFELGIPVLGICYGYQLMAIQFGGKVATGPREYGKQSFTHNGGKLFKGVPAESDCWMSHTDYVEKLPDGFKATASTSTCPIVAIESESKKMYGVQFHPEVMHTKFGTEILRNFTAAVRGEESLLVRGEEGIHGVRLLNAMLLSAWTNEEVGIPFDERQYARLLTERAARSKQKTAAADEIEDNTCSFGGF